MTPWVSQASRGDICPTARWGSSRAAPGRTTCTTGSDCQPSSVPRDSCSAQPSTKALAVYHQARLEGKDASLDQLLGAFRERWEGERLPVKLKAGETVKALAERTEAMLGLYAASPHLAGNVIAVEEPFRFRFAEGVPEIMGVIDLVEKGADGSLVLTDFKTAASRSAPAPEQLVLYREALRALDYPESDAITLRYVVLLKTSKGDIVVFQPQVQPDHAQRLRKRYAAVWRDIQCGCSFPQPDWQCADCQWRRHCDQA